MPDGSRLSMDLPGFEVGPLWLTGIKVQRGALDGKTPDSVSMQDFSVAPRGNAQGVMDHVLHASVVQRFTVQGGELQIAVSDDPQTQGMAVWVGPHHELSTLLLPGEAVSSAVAMFDGLLMEDGVEGLVVRGAVAAETSILVEYTEFAVLGVGEMVVRPVAQALRAVPEWSGAKIPVGEVWRLADVDEAGDPRSGLRIASPSVVIDVEVRRSVAAKAIGSALQLSHSMRTADWKA